MFQRSAVDFLKKARTQKRACETASSQFTLATTRLSGRIALMSPGKCLHIIFISLVACSPLFSAPSGSNVHWSPQFGPPGVPEIATAIHVAANGNILVSQYCGPDTNCPVQLWDGRNWRSLGIVSGGLACAQAIQERNSVWYFAGSFEQVDGVTAKNIASWDGSRWSALGEGLPQGLPQAMQFYKGELYAGGWGPLEGAPLLRKWDGTQWSDLSGSFGPGRVWALMVEGDYLYSAGDFSLGGANVARWNGARWEPVGNRLVDGGYELVRSIAFFRNELYALVGGDLIPPPKSPTGSLWRWNGDSWTKIDASYQGGGPTAIATWNDSLYINGSFTNLNSQTARSMARFDGVAFQPVPGLATAAQLQAGPDALYFAGGFDYVANAQADAELRWILAPNVARWNGSEYENIYAPEFSNGLGLYPAVFAHENEKLYAGGIFRAAGNASAHYIAVWDGHAWNGLGTGMENRPSPGTARVSGILSKRDEVFAGGTFTHAGGVPANNIAIWNGQSWRAAGDGFNNRVNVIIEHEGRIYAGGVFTKSGSLSIPSLAAWNGSSWEEAGCCLTAQAGDGVVRAATLEDSLFVAGKFGGVNAVYKLVAGQFDLVGSFDRPVTSIETSGGILYASGDFGIVNGQPIPYIAKWDGNSWSTASPPLDSSVWALAFHKGALHVGGAFRGTVSGLSLNGVGRLDPQSGQWQALGSGLYNSPTVPAVVRTLYSTGDDLYVGGTFIGIGDRLDPGAIESHYIARWNEDVDFYKASTELRLNAPAIENGSLTFYASGSGAQIILEASFDLKNWTALGTLSETVSHSEPVTSSQRFFRARTD